MTTLREAAQALIDYDDAGPDDGKGGWLHWDAKFDALRAALAEPQSGWDKWQEQKRGCSVCGIGANGEAVGYVCTRNDCPTRVTCGGAQ